MKKLIFTFSITAIFVSFILSASGYPTRIYAVAGDGLNPGYPSYVVGSFGKSVFDQFVAAPQNTQHAKPTLTQYVAYYKAVNESAGNAVVHFWQVNPLSSDTYSDSSFNAESKPNPTDPASINQPVSGYNPPISATFPSDTFIGTGVNTDPVTGQKYTINITTSFGADGQISSEEYAKMEVGTNIPLGFVKSTYYYEDSGNISSISNVQLGADHTTVLGSKNNQFKGGVIQEAFTLPGSAANSGTQFSTKCSSDDLTNTNPACYQPLSPIAGFNDDSSADQISNFPKYLQAAYRLGIGICFVLGVIMFTWAGIEYIVSEVMNTKAEAKKRMVGSVIGLIIALASYIVLNTINPDLLQLKSLKIQPVKLTAPGSVPATTQATQPTQAIGQGTNNVQPFNYDTLTGPPQPQAGTIDYSNPSGAPNTNTSGGIAPGTFGPSGN